MCPITEKYMKNEYLDSVANIPVRVDGRSEKGSEADFSRCP